MNRYITMDEKTMEVITSGATRAEAFEKLKTEAKPDAVYLELKIIGEPLELRTRKVSTLGRVKETVANSTEEQGAE